MSRRPRPWRPRLLVSEVQFFETEPENHARGFLGHVAFVLDRAVRLDSISVRQTIRGCPYLSYPRRIDRGGREHFYSLPIDDNARRDIERQVIAQLRLLEVIP